MKLSEYIAAARGRLANLAEHLGKATPYVHQMSAGLRSVPPALCVKIERFTSGEVTRYDLRPQDAHLIWPPEEQRCAECPHDFPSLRDSHDG